MNYSERVDEREKELNLLRVRQDADRDLLYLTRYVMKDAKNKAIADIINVTLPKLATFAKNVIAAMGSTSEQIIVESPNPSFDTYYVESFQKAFFKENDRGLRQRGMFPLNPFFDEQICIRGGMSARCVPQKVNGILIPNIHPWDFRFVTWENDADGLEYAAYGQNTLRSASLILAEYGVKIKGTYGQVLDVWDRTHNEVWIDGKIEREQRHNFGFTPVIIEIVPSGSMLQDTDAIAHHGESIFSLVRDVNPELNRLISILQTLNLKAVKPPMKVKKQGGGKAPQYEDITAMGSDTAMDINEDIAPIDYGDARRAAEMAYGILDKAMQEGSLNSFDMGTFDQSMSAIALIQIGEGRDQVFAPILNTKAYGNADLAEMFTKQVLQIGGEIEFGIDGRRSRWDTSKLKGEYITTYQYFPKSPKIEMARFSMAASVGNLISERDKRIEILQREDPEGDERQLRWEEAEMISPAIRMNRIIRGLADMAEKGDETTEFEAELLSAEMGVSLQMMLQGQGGNLPMVEKNKGQQMIPAFPTPTSQGAKEASDLAKTPEMP